MVVAQAARSVLPEWGWGGGQRAGWGGRAELGMRALRGQHPRGPLLGRRDAAPACHPGWAVRCSQPDARLRALLALKPQW